MRCTGVPVAFGIVIVVIGVKCVRSKDWIAAVEFEFTLAKKAVFSVASTVRAPVALKLPTGRPVAGLIAWPSSE